MTEEPPRTIDDETQSVETEASPAESWTEEDVERFRSMLGGKSGLVDGAVPALLFVVGNAIWSLNMGAIAAAAYGLGTLAYRAIRRQKIRHALYGLAGLTLSIGLAVLTKKPSAFFIQGAVIGVIYGLLLLGSVALRQPMSTFFAMAFERRPQEYYRQPEVRRMHMLVTGAWALVYLGRATFRAYLIANDQTELLGASALFLGYPLNAALIAGSVMYLRRGAQRLESTPEPAPTD